MALETFSGTYIDGLNASNPAVGDNVSEGADHLRGIKLVLQNTFPNVSGAITSTHTELNILDGCTATYAELNLLATRSLSSTDDVIDNFPSGTLMLFGSTGSPTGWTKNTSFNDYSIKITSGTVGYGGSVGFATLFARTATDAHTLTTAEIPSHSHVIDNTLLGQNHATLQAQTSAGSTFSNILPWTGTNSTNTSGSGGSHTHNIDMQLKYRDFILAQKD